MALLPLTLVVIAIFFEYSGLDIWWVSKFFDFDEGLWPFKHHLLFSAVIHKGGQWFVKFMALAWCIIFSLTYFHARFTPLRKILIFFLLATVTGPVLVSICKQFTHIYTPWDLTFFQGEQPYIRILDTVPAGSPVGHAFPAGHASGGYAFLSFYFLMLNFRSPHRLYGLLFGLSIGLIFGLGQQIRGAHFPSHDLFSLVVCWYASLSTYLLFYPKEWENLKQCQV